MADDDLDELLDEVESKYCGPGPPESSCSGAERDRQKPTRKTLVHASTEEENLDDLIDDLLDVNCKEDNVTQKKISANKQSCKTSNQMPKRKCSPVYAGGNSLPFGIATVISERACDQLRCTACDFKVVIFDNCEWDASCDYYFFRNSMPDISRLQTKTIRKKGPRAYACQCSWRTIQERTEIRTDQQLKWVCGKH
ncbi:cilia- and flagella-associated protein 418 isoform X2 [Bombina bombina]|uniref:cilia- and flagella-associated protein 418 isoform X2 n=1 Tax=Bombina bombina TaxID=8345 RepID=UPI00235B1529|nr:cilia- and flagella-associated protein 418 isoform X2 [Bombina bombina]